MDTYYFSSIPTEALFDSLLQSAIETKFKVEFSRDNFGCFVAFKEFNNETMEYDLYEKYSYCKAMGYKLFNGEESIYIPEDVWLSKVAERFKAYDVVFDTVIKS